MIAALVAVHALTGRDITRLRLADLDLSAGRLVVRRPGLRHVVHLDPVTHQLAADWLRERHRRWWSSADPHLLVSPQSALDPGGPPIAGPRPQEVFGRRGLVMRDVRQDRIRDEAALTADPVHLIRLFGISSSTAMRYIAAVHPERTAKPPR
ncbi:hypothetical protein [Streptosporangium roseum]|uniref:hypothetical protein n=1 Tax=Streptosporangium roseum TaxID=2001 RepID=UPI0033291711